MVQESLRHRTKFIDLSEEEFLSRVTWGYVFIDEHLRRLERERPSCPVCVWKFSAPEGREALW